MHHDRLKPYNSDVVPVWVQRLQSQVLQSCQNSAIPPPEVDSSTVPEPPLPEDTSEDPTDDGASLKSRDRGEAPQHGRPSCQQEKGPAARDSPGSVENFQWASGS